MCLPQISQMTQTNHKTQSSNNHNNHNNQPVFICGIMQLAAFPLRDLRNLRENIHMRVLNQYIQKKPQCLPQISLIYADKPLNYTNSNISFSAK